MLISGGCGAFTEGAGNPWLSPWTPLVEFSADKIMGKLGSGGSMKR